MGSPVGRLAGWPVGPVQIANRFTFFNRPEHYGQNRFNDPAGSTAHGNNGLNRLSIPQTESRTRLRGPVAPPGFQFLGVQMFSYRCSLFSFLSLATIWVQAQKVSWPTSQYPPLEPPQGPLKRLLAQRATGQIPPVWQDAIPAALYIFRSRTPGLSDAPERSCSAPESPAAAQMHPPGFEHRHRMPATGWHPFRPVSSDIRGPGPRSHCLRIEPTSNFGGGALIMPHLRKLATELFSLLFAAR